MSFNEICSNLNLSAKESKSFKMKTNFLLDHIFGKKKPTKLIQSVINKGEKVMVGARPLRVVKIDGKIYGSLTIASKALGVSASTISRRCLSSSFKNYKYM